MSKARKKFSCKFNLKVVEAYESGVSAVELSRQFEIHPNVVYAGAREYRRDPANAFRSGEGQNDPPRADEQRLAELERMVGRLALENDFLKKALMLAKNILSKGNPGLRSRDASNDRRAIRSASAAATVPSGRSAAFKFLPGRSTAGEPGTRPQQSGAARDPCHLRADAWLRQPAGDD